MPGRNDLATRESVSQKAALSGRSASFAIASNRLSNAKVSIPAEKHQVASERCFRQAATAAKPAVNMPAAKANTEFGLTIRSELT
jgi:hypothetical protein